jgi:hypothetical protein
MSDVFDVRLCPLSSCHSLLPVFSQQRLRGVAVAWLECPLGEPEVAVGPGRHGARRAAERGERELRDGRQQAA